MDLQAACEVCGYENGMYVVYIPDDVTRPSKQYFGAAHLGSAVEDCCIEELGDSCVEQMGWDNFSAQASGTGMLV